MFVADPTPAQRLAWLYLHAKPIGLGRLHYDFTPLLVEDAEKMLPSLRERKDGVRYADYVYGRCIKCALSADEDGSLWDRDYGDGSYKRVMGTLQESLDAGLDLDDIIRDAVKMRQKLSDLTLSPEWW